jgi:hypothetical protein
MEGLMINIDTDDTDADIIAKIFFSYYHNIQKNEFLIHNTFNNVINTLAGNEILQLKENVAKIMLNGKHVTIKKINENSTKLHFN